MMRKVSSAPSLSSMDRLASVAPPANASKLASTALPAKGHPAFSAPLKVSRGRSSASRGDALKTHALPLDTAPPPFHPVGGMTTDAEFLYAVAREGLVTATACMPAIEMEDAPALVGSATAQSLVRERDAADMAAASCMATPVMPSDRTNGELVHRRAAKLGSEAELQLRVRYAAEVSYASRAAGAGDGRFRLRRANSRKRSLDDLDALLALAGGEGGGDTGASVGEAGAKLSSPETKRLLAARVGLLEDHSNKLHLDDHPELPKPDSSISLEEPDHEWLVGGSTASLASMDSTATAEAPQPQEGQANVVPFRRAAAPCVPAK